ncbi:MAG: DUF1127 domain-containing protein [Rhodospirillaceae bacterium]|jgi:uncharacterized protein YjiS (DUF1127 family)|nr:DUF1127 domain-containing protein [Rhodospirillaceae bacterium]MBT6138648.1 DUF1127 domain-containing protein [Rhodospirillaceae bacterium]
MSSYATRSSVFSHMMVSFELDVKPVIRSLFREIVSQPITAAVAYQKKRRTEILLRGLSDHTLRDIGIERPAIRSVASLSVANPTRRRTWAL